jgi:hypothetical protein
MASKAERNPEGEGPEETKYAALLKQYEEENGPLSEEDRKRLIKTWEDAEEDKNQEE